MTKKTLQTKFKKSYAGFIEGKYFLLILFLVLGLGLLLVSWLSKPGGQNTPVIIRMTALTDAKQDNPLELRVDDFRMYADGHVIYKRKSGKFRSRDFELYSASTKSSVKNELQKTFEEKNFFALPSVVGTKEPTTAPIYITASFGGKEKTVEVGRLAEGDVGIKEIIGKLSEFSAAGEKLYTPKKIYLYAIKLTGKNAAVASAQGNPTPWEGSRVSLGNYTDSPKPLSGAELETVLANSGREFFGYFTADKQIYQTSIKWELSR